MYDTPLGLCNLHPVLQLWQDWYIVKWRFHMLSNGGLTGLVWRGMLVCCQMVVRVYLPTVNPLPKLSGTLDLKCWCALGLPVPNATRYYPILPDVTR